MVIAHAAAVPAENRPARKRRRFQVAPSSDRSTSFCGSVIFDPFCNLMANVTRHGAAAKTATTPRDPIRRSRGCAGYGQPVFLLLVTHPSPHVVLFIELFSVEPTGAGPRMCVTVVGNRERALERGLSSVWIAAGPFL